MISKEWEIQLQQLRAELILFRESIRETAEDIISQGYSQYPIFIAHTTEVSVGELILDSKDLSTYWNISASTLEDFITNKVIPEEKAEFFKTNYKDPQQYICFFVIYGMEGRFVYIPFQPSNITNN